MQDRDMYPGGQPFTPYPPPPPAPPARPAARVAAGLMWALAAALAIGSQFGDIYRTRVTWSRSDDDVVITGFWQSRSVFNGNEAVEPAFNGASVLVAITALVVASVLVFVTLPRWGALVAGALGAGMMLDEAVSYVTVAVTNDDNTRVGPGWWLIVGAAVMAVAAFVVALTERRGRPVRPHPAAPPYPPPPPPWPSQQASVWGPPPGPPVR
jgi:hypothetical protein